MWVKKQPLRTLYGTTDWFKTEKEVRQGCLLSPCLFNLYTEHIIRNARPDELQAGIKTGGRNTDKLRYADDTILMADSEEELKSLLMRVKEESESAYLSLKIKQNYDHGIQPHYCMPSGRGKCRSSERFPLLGLQNHCGW